VCVCESETTRDRNCFDIMLSLFIDLTYCMTARVCTYVSDYKAGNQEKIKGFCSHDPHLLDLLVCETITDGKELLGSESILWHIPSSPADKVISHATIIHTHKREVVIHANKIWFQLCHKLIALPTIHSTDNVIPH